MTRKDRVKTYLMGVLLGVLLLIVWNYVRSGMTPQNTGGAGVPSPPAQQPSDTTDTGAPTDDDPPRSSE